MSKNTERLKQAEWNSPEPPDENVVANDYKGDPIYSTDSYLELDGELFMPGDALDFIKQLGATEVKHDS